MDRPFDKPTNTWIEEEIEMPVMVPHVNEKEKRVEIVQEMKKVKQRTFYADSPQKRVVCNNHHYLCINPGRYVYKCSRCDWHRIAFPISYKFDPTAGTLTHRKTGQVV